MENAVIDLNEGWFFAGKWDSRMAEPGFDLSAMEAVSIPHTVTVTPFSCFDEHVYQMLSGYRKILSVPSSWKGKTVLLTIDGAAHDAQVFVNGKEAAHHSCGYTAFTADITSALRIPEKGAQENVLAIRLDSRESLNIPPFGNVIDYMTYGGITRSITLKLCEPAYLENIFVTTPGAEDPSASPEVQSLITLHLPQGRKAHSAGTGHISAAASGASAPYEIMQILTDGNGTVLKTVSGEVTPSADGAVTLCFPAGPVDRWDIRRPALCRLRTRLSCGGKLLDEQDVRFGFRGLSFRADGFYLNGEKIRLRGLNRHQSYPYVGYAMPDRLQREDADILKYELGCNAVRTSHYPQAQSFIDRCDEIGLLVFTELPGWQHIGNEKWKKAACTNLREMILQYRNHPAIFLWGVRINESQDDDAFYTETNRIAHELDPSRPTGGVRFLQKSHLLEDVYTYNDFLHNGSNAGCLPKKDVTPDMSKGYLISEYNGHMFPTKSFDCEDHRTEHVMRHLTVLNAAASEPDIAGSFGWCMFDYNTHRDFGAGDRICYHGVMDMFRNPKTAAAVYASQSDEKDVFELTSTMDIGEHPGGNLPEVIALTNADSIRLYRNDEFVKEFFPDKKRFGALPHPPVFIDDFVGGLIAKHEKYTEAQAEKIKEALGAIAKYGQNGLPLRHKVKIATLMAFQHLTMEDGLRLYYGYVGNWGGKVITYRFDAIRGGNVVASRIRTPSSADHLEIRVGTGTPEAPGQETAAAVHELAIGRTYDAESLRFRMLDSCGNLLPYYQECLQLHAEGAVSLIGPCLISLKGGMGGTYVRTNGSTGDGTLKIEWDGHQETVHFHVSENKGG